MVLSQVLKTVWLLSGIRVFGLIWWSVMVVRAAVSSRMAPVGLRGELLISTGLPHTAQNEMKPGLLPSARFGPTGRVLKNGGVGKRVQNIRLPAGKNTP